jgi:hypothetical protein
MGTVGLLESVQTRLVALDGRAADIPVDCDILVVGRHAECDVRIDSIRVSRRHCCMTKKNGELTVRDLGSTNGIRINGKRVQSGRVRPGDELSIAHFRFRLEGAQGFELPPEDSASGIAEHPHPQEMSSPREDSPRFPLSQPADSAEDNPVAAALRELLSPRPKKGCSESTMR